MKRVLYIILLVLLSITLYSEQITKGEAIQLVKDFENNQNLTGLSVEYLKKDATDTMDYCVVTLKDENNDKSWTIGDNYICIYNNHKESDNHYYGGYSSLFINENFSMEQCKDIAINYLNSKNISLVGFDTNPVCGIFYPTYHFNFEQFIDKELNLKSTNMISVEINSFTGNVETFSIVKGPLFAITERPNLTDSQAFESAQKVYPNIKDNPVIKGYFINDTYSSIYRGVIYGNNILMIDAYTHEFLGVRDLNSSFTPGFIKYNKPEGSDKIKILTEDEYLETIELDNDTINLILCDYYVGSPSEKTEVTESYEIDKECKDIVRMELNGNELVFRVNSPWCFINKKVYYMDDVCDVNTGKLLLPAEFYKKIQDRDSQFFRK